MFNRFLNRGVIYGGVMSKYFVFKQHSWSVFKRLYSKEVPTFKKRIISGIQPTGNIHLGNYLGAIQKWVELQNSNEDTFWFIADMHAITIPQDTELLRENIFKTCAMLLACGIDPNRSVVFQQSKISMHGELCWILSTLLMSNRLTHLHHYKEKANNAKYMLHGLLSYPILQAADIMLYKATNVPVGEDQVQHIQLVEHIAQKFNTNYGNTFPLPQALINPSGNRIKSLKDASKKMSKSSDNKKSRIELIDEPDVILNKLKKAVTDFTSEVYFDNENRPGVSNLLTIHSLITGKTVENICKEVEGLNTGKYKLYLADVLIEKLNPIRNRYSELMNEPDYLINVLQQGAEKAKVEAEYCMQEVYDKIGFSLNKRENLTKAIKSQ